MKAHQKTTIEVAKEFIMSKEEIKKLIDNLESKFTQVQGALGKYGKRLDDVEDRIGVDIEMPPGFEEGIDDQK